MGGLPATGATARCLTVRPTLRRRTCIASCKGGRVKRRRRSVDTPLKKRRQTRPGDVLVEAPSMHVRNAKYSFSGHQTFPFRYTWLPKGVHALRRDPTVFSKPDAMVELGVGK